MSTRPLLSVRNLSAGFLERVILQDVSFDVGHGQIVGIMGPSGVGKSTLLRTLSRWNELLPNFWRTGGVTLDGRDLLEKTGREASQRLTPLLAQKKRLYTASVLANVLADVPGAQRQRDEQVAMARQQLETLGLWREFESQLDEPVVSLSIASQRRIAMTRVLAGGGRCLLADEPLRDISEEEVAVLKGFLQRMRSRASVVMVTHNLRHARSLCDTIVLLVAGRVVEVSSCERFFSEPQTSLGKNYLRTGNCWPSEQELQAEEWAPKAVGPKAADGPEKPGSFYWTLENQLGGMQMPGLLKPLEVDLEGLRSLGCRVLVSLRSEKVVDPKRLAEVGVSGFHFPIVDMEAPSPELALDLCRKIAAWLEQGLPTVLHCKAGLGRTGTILACFLVFRGSSAVAAVEDIRSVNPYYIQSDVQIDFIATFERFLRATA